ncbi:MAG: CvpA family protein [bacterium]
MDLIIIFSVLGFMISGYYSGLRRRFCSLLFPSLGLVVALNNHAVIAPVFNRVLHNYPAAVLLSFSILLAATWLGLRLAYRLVLKIVDWSRLEYIDIFLGGIFGLAKGLAVVWLGLVLTLVVFPPSVHLLTQSRASVRVLALAERVLNTQALLSCGVEKLMSRTAEQVEGLRFFLQAGSHWRRALNLPRAGGPVLP